VVDLTVVDLPSDSAIAEALSAAGSAHHEYEQTALKGVRDELWAGFYAAFVLGRLGDFTAASRLAALLEEVDAPSNWSEAAAEHVATTLRAQSDAMAPTVTDVSDRRRFEIEVDGAVLGFAEYRRRPGVITFIHTEIDPAHEGEGLGTLLVKAALDTARAEGLAVLPYCPFVRGFIDRHREYLDLVPVERRANFTLDDG
jgi:predicted GNAT family acetyltransferase